MGYDVSCEIRGHTKELLVQKLEDELKTTMEALENVQDTLCQSLTVDELIAALRCNGVVVADLLIEKDSIAQAVLLSDYLAHGVPEDCPVCGCASLSWASGRITCWGYVQGLSKCHYKSATCRRYKFVLPPAWADAAWFSELRGGGEADKKKGGKGKKTKKKTSVVGLALTGGLNLVEEKKTDSSEKVAVGSSSQGKSNLQLITQQLEKMIASAILVSDASWTKKTCRAQLSELFGGEAQIEANKAFVNSEILRLTQDLRAMSADQLAAYAEKCEAVTQEDIDACFGKDQASPKGRTAPEKCSPVLEVHRGYEQVKIYENQLTPKFVVLKSL